MAKNPTKRLYEKTHPWLTFRFDATRLSARAWMLLGEACSKCDHIATAPLRPDVAERLYALYLAKGVAATTAIEGNTLSEEEVRRHLEGKLHLPPSKAYLQQEIENVLQASNAIAEEMMKGVLEPLSSVQIKAWNRQLLQDLPHDADVVPGELRAHSVVVMRYRGAPAADCELLLDRLCNWLNESEFRPSEASSRMSWGILRAVLAHLYLAWIHPFGDGNGRTARLMELQILLDAGVPMPTSHLLSNFYNQTRTEYYRQLDYASQSGGDIFPFIEYALQGLVDGLKEQLEVVRGYQWEVAWRDLVFRTFGGRSGPSEDRRRELALALSTLIAPVPLSEVPDINLRLSRAYTGKTARTMQRDLQELIEMKLARRIGSHSNALYEANRERILSFLPPRRAA